MSDYTHASVGMVPYHIKPLSKRQQRKALGLCVVCPRPWSGPTAECRDCLEKRRERRNARIARGVCSNCRHPRTDAHLNCANCRVHRRAWDQKSKDTRIRNNQCINCSSRAMPTSRQCETCFLMATAHRILGARERWQELKDLLVRQNYRCAYTDEVLTLGGNATIDHKIPTSRKGSKNIDNIQWITWTANCLKSSLTHDEFLDFCIVVARKAGRDKPLLPKLYEKLQLNHKKKTIKPVTANPQE